MIPRMNISWVLWGAAGVLTKIGWRVVGTHASVWQPFPRDHQRRSKSSLSMAVIPAPYHLAEANRVRGLGSADAEASPDQTQGKTMNKTT